MTKIYTINTLEVYANSQHIDAKVGEPLSLVVDIKINWVDQSSAQRILFYQWEQSLDRGVSWTQILSDKNVSVFDDRSSNTIYTNSYLVNGEFDFKWANFNIFSNQSPKAYLDTTRVVAAQNQARYRCNVFLYNVDSNIIESVATSDTMTLYVVDSNNNPIKDTDILWDAIPNKRISKDTTLDQNSIIKLFNPSGVTNNVDILLNGVKIISNAVLPTSSGNALSINLGNYVDSFDPSNITIDTNLGQINAGLNSLAIQQSQKTTTFSVNPRSSWQSTGLSVTNGMKLVISANGSVVWGGGGSVGPDGVYNSSSLNLGGVSVDARFKHEALLGKVGSNIFLIGSYYVGTMTSAGTLEVATNDIARSDNSGSFDMTISSSTIKTTPISVLAVKSDGSLADLSTLQKGVASTLDSNGNLISNTIRVSDIVNSDPFTSTGAITLLFNFKPAPPASPTPTATITPTVTPTSVTPTPTVSPGTSPTPTPTLSVSVTPTLTPTVTTSSSSSDPYFGYVTLLLHADGDGTTFVDSSSVSPARTVGNIGSATQSSTQSKFGGKSLYLNGSQYLSTSINSLILDREFVIEAWVYPTTLESVYSPLFDCRLASGSFQNWACGLMNVGGTYRIDFLHENSTFGRRLTGTSTSVPLNAWTHIAIVRTLGTGALGSDRMSIYVNGILDSTTKDVTSLFIPDGGNILIGRTRDGNVFNGYMDEIRITSGSSRGYTGSSITTPTSIFPSSGPAQTAKISVLKTNGGSSTLAGNGTIVSPFARDTKVTIGDTDGISKYKFTASQACNVVVIFKYNDDDGGGDSAYAYKNNTTVLGSYINDGETSKQILSLAQNDYFIITGNSPDYNSIENVIVYAY